MDQAKRLRVCLLVESFSVPAWLACAIRDLIDSSFARVVVVAKHDACWNTGQYLSKRSWPTIGQFLLALYRKFDELLFPLDLDPSREVNIKPLIGGYPIVSVRLEQQPGKRTVALDNTTALLAYDLDVMLALSNVKVDSGEVARYGVWFHKYCGNRLHQGNLPGFSEIIRNRRTTCVTLNQRGSALQTERTIYRSCSSTHKYSLNKNASQVYWKASKFIIRKLRDVHHWGEAGLDQLGCDLDGRGKVEPELRSPDSKHIFKFCAKASGRLCHRGARKVFYRDQWVLAYCIGETSWPLQHSSTAKYIRPSKDRFWADPFPVDAGDKVYIFVEEYIYKENKGLIAVIELDERGQWRNSGPVLNESYHLSYPFIFKWLDCYYMIPETAEEKAIKIYRCTEFPFKWELDRIVMENVRAVDTTLQEIQGTWWMFTNIGGDGFSMHDELYLFHARTPFGPWEPHKRNPVKSDVRSARPAGRLFQRGDHIYRPAQDCSEGIGLAVSINRIDFLSPDQFVEKEIARIMPTQKTGIRGIHTVNRAGKFTVIDCLVYKRKFV